MPQDVQRGGEAEPDGPASRALQRPQLWTRRQDAICRSRVCAQRNGWQQQRRECDS
jgi:hypothetical protein